MAKKARKAVRKPPRRKVIKADAIETRDLRILDDRGVARISMNAAFGMPVIHLNDKSGRPAISLQATDDGDSFVTLFSRSNSPCVTLYFNERGSGFSINSAQGGRNITLHIPGQEKIDSVFHDRPNIVVFDEGRLQWAVYEPPPSTAQSQP